MPKISPLKCFTVVLMCCCLLFLTGINFVIYSGDAAGICLVIDVTEDNSSDEVPPEKPVEEKSSTGNNSIQEEYVHEQHALHNMLVADNTLKYALLNEAKLSVVHFELISPPPDL